MAFGSGPKVLVRAPDGSGLAIHNARVERVEADGTQEVSCDALEWWDVEVFAEAIQQEAE